MNSAIASLALYSGLLALIGIWLTSNVAGIKRKANILIGDGGDPVVIRAMRGQANFIETVPMTLILLLMLVFLGTPAWVIHILGLVLLIGRALHANHFINDGAPGWHRHIGFMMTAVAMGLGAIGSIVLAIWSMIF